MGNKYNLTVHLGNYNGMRNQIDEKGRIQTTLESLLQVFPDLVSSDFRIIDNYSDDNSWEYIEDLDFAKKKRIQGVQAKEPWLVTTINNMENLKDSIRSSDSKYFWNVENDSYFYGNGDFVDKAIRILKENPDISLVHLKRWTYLDEYDSPGVPTNMNRFEEERKTSQGDDFYVLEQKDNYSLWIPIERNHLISLDDSAGIGKCPLGNNKIGAVRLNSDNSLDRILTEHWNGYTSHGWIGRREDIANLLDKYKPLGERQMSMAFKQEGLKSARMNLDGFVDFGWKSRVKPSQEEVKEVLRDVLSNRFESSIKLFGNYKPSFEAAPVEFNGEINVYN